MSSRSSSFTRSQLRQQMLDVIRQRRLPLPLPFRLRMNESQPNRVQRLAVERRQCDRPTTPAIRRIADQWMTDRRKMNADLMRASRFQRALHERCRAKALERFDVRTRRFAARHDCHRRTDARMAADRRIDRRCARDVAMHEGDVFAFDRARLQLPHEIGLRNGCFRDHQKAACILIEPMNDAGTRKRGELRRVMQKRVQQSSVAVAAAGVDNQARRLVDNDKGVVLVDDAKLDRLWCIRNGEWILHRRDDDSLAAGKPSLALRNRAIERHAPRIDPVLEPTAGMLRNQPGERQVEAQPGELGWHRELEWSCGSAIANRCVGSAIIRATHEGWHR